jgi:uroporphyrinogen decarboxylase
MTGNERVRALLARKPTDRMPVYGWVRANLEDGINERWGSVEAFEDRYEFDLAHLFGGPDRYGAGDLDAVRTRAAEQGRAVEPSDLLEIELADPDDEVGYASLRADVAFHRESRGRFVYVQTPGVFEAHNGFFGIENHLMYLLLYPDELARVYARQAEWTARFASNCLDLGIDMIHVSDDWGSQRGLLFSPDVFHGLIAPYHAPVAELVHRRGGYLSLHSDGNIEPAIGAIKELGFAVVHPWQESAGMSFDRFQREYRDSFAVMGGIDVQTTIGFGDQERFRSEVGALIERFSDGGLILCTTHFVQDHCTVAELEQSFDFVYDRVREVARR